MFDAPLQVGSLQLNGRALLAPLAGVSDQPFRRMCQRMGAALTYIEMLASNAVQHRNRRTLRMCERHDEEPLLGVQITGSSAEDIARAITVLNGMSFDTIDINMGCPIRKIVAKGWGCAMLLDGERVTETVQRAREATSLPLSVKIRTGYARDTINVEEIAGRIAEAGAQMLTIHGRTREDKYGTDACWERVRIGSQSARARSTGGIVTVGNGDALSLDSCRTMLEATACDALMIARGALGNPWIFADLLRDEAVRIMPETWLETVLEHARLHEEFHGDTSHTAAQFRKHLMWYAQGFPGSRRLRDELGRLDTMQLVRDAITTFAGILPPDCIRTPGYRYQLNEEK